MTIRSSYASSSASRFSSGVVERDAIVTPPEPAPEAADAAAGLGDRRAEGLGDGGMRGTVLAARPSSGLGELPAATPAIRRTATAA